MKNVSGLLLIGMLIILTACEDEDLTPEFNLIANVSTVESVETGVEVILDGTGSVDESGEGFEVEWTFVSAPPESEAVLSDANSTVARFTPDVGGEYVVMLAIENQYGSDSDQVSILAIGTGDGMPLTVVEIINTSEIHETLSLAVNEAGLTENLSGQGPFTVFAPTDNAFTGLPEGTIDRLLNDPSGVLRDMLLYHVAGDKALSSDLADGLEIETLFGDLLTVSINDDGIFIDDVRVTVTDIQAQNGVVHVIDAVLIPTLKIGGDYGNDLTLFYPFDYLVTDRFRVLNQSQLTITPGTTIFFSENTSLIIGDGSTINAVGNDSDKILLTSTEKTPGWWSGVQIAGTQSSNNILNNVIIEYGGGGTYWSTQSRKANLVVGGRLASDATRLVISNSIFRYSEDAGIYVRDPSVLPDSHNNTYTENKVSGIIAASGIEFFDSGSDYTGNETDGMEIYTGNFSSGNTTWKGLGVPYIVNDRIVVTEIELTVEAGAEFAFKSDTYFSVEAGAIIKVNGEEGDPVIMTGTEETPGWWRGFILKSSMSTQNELNHVIIEYAGGGGFWSTHSTYANLVVGGRIESEAARLKVNNSVFRYSKEHGLHLTSSSEMPESSNNTYTGNTKAPVFMAKSGMHFLDSGSSFTGNNGNDHVLVVNAGNTSGSLTWNKLNVPFRASEEIQVYGTSITIEPGAVFEFESGAGLSFRENSVIQIEGTSDDPIIFTGSEKIAGWWKGVLLSDLPSSQNSIDHIIVEYGGGYSYWSTQNQLANLVIGGRTGSDASRVSVTNSSFLDSGDYGIVISADSNVNEDLCTANTFENSPGGNCFFR